MVSIAHQTRHNNQRETEKERKGRQAHSATVQNPGLAEIGWNPLSFFCNARLFFSDTDQIFRTLFFNNKTLFLNTKKHFFKIQNKYYNCLNKSYIELPPGFSGGVCHVPQLLPWPSIWGGSRLHVSPPALQVSSKKIFSSSPPHPPCLRILFRTLNHQYDYTFDWTMLKQKAAASAAVGGTVAPVAPPAMPGPRWAGRGGCNIHSIFIGIVFLTVVTVSALVTVDKLKQKKTLSPILNWCILLMTFFFIPI